MRPEILALVIAVYIALVLNRPFWQKFLALVAPHRASDWLFVGAAGIAAVLLGYLVLLAFSQKHLLRAIVLVLLPVSAAAAYFMGEYGVVVDSQTVRNVVETDAQEAGDLITLKFAGYVVFLGLVPAIAFCLVPWTKRTWRDETLAKLKYAAIAVAVLVACCCCDMGQCSFARARASRTQNEADAAELRFQRFLRIGATRAVGDSRSPRPTARMRIALRQTRRANRCS